MTDETPDRSDETDRGERRPRGSDGEQDIEGALSEFLNALEETWERTELSENPPPLDDLVDPVGETIAHYRILRRLGAGGMGEVYAAEDTRLRREVALKLLPGNLPDDPDWRQRFLSEARNAAALAHPRVCVVYEVGETAGGRPYIAMERIEGETLSERARARQLGIGEILDLGIQVADALAAAHEKGIVHRDIKPSNVMLDARGLAKVLDFGLAKRLVLDPDRAQGTESLIATAPGRVVGTPVYMSPEQARGTPVDHRTDIFSLGVVLYELATGRLPFVGPTVDDTVHRILHAEPPPMREARPDVPGELERIIVDLCLAKDRERRCASARDLRDALRALRRALGDIDGASTSDDASILDDATDRSKDPLALPPAELVKGSDILINCAAIDDLPLSPDRRGWVSQFQRHLQVRLNQLWGEPVKMSLCPMPAGDTGIDDRLVEYVSDIKTMVSVLSPPFIKAGGCRREVEEFWKTAESSGGLWVGDKARLLKVVKTPVDTRELSADLAALFERLLAFEFYEIDPETGRVREFDELFGLAAKQRFFERVYDLAQELCVTLKSCGPGGLAGDMAAPTRRAVYLAETTSDLQNERDRLRRELQEQGHTVLPAHALPLSAGELERAVKEYLRRADASIHLIGDRYGFIPEGADESIVELQHRWSTEQAREGELQRFIWMPEGLAPVEPRQEDFVARLHSDPENHDGVEVVCGLLSTLKRLLVARLAPVETQVGARAAGRNGEAGNEEKARSGDAPPLVYLICDARDEGAATAIQDWLFEQGLEVSLPDFEADESEFVRLHREMLASCDAALVYYGAVRRSWVETKLRDLMKATGYGRLRPLATKAVYVAPEGDARKERFRTHLAELLRAGDHVDALALGGFVESVRRTAVP